MRTRSGWILIGLALTACGTDRPAGLDSGDIVSDVQSGALRVYTQNLYVGADVDKVIAAPAAQLPAALLNALAVFASTDFPTRAGRMADAIGRQDPDVIGLEEVTHLTVQGLGVVGFPDVDADFLAILGQQLAARGLAYDVVAVSPNTNITIPVPLPDGSFATIALKDADAILVRHEVGFDNIITKNYQAKFSTSLGPLPIDILRGYAAADILVRGRSYRFVVTHPEPRGTGLPIQAAQTQELIQDLAGTRLPLVVVGDFNSSPTSPEPETPYHQMRAAGFVDLWTRTAPGRGEGFTCCQIEDLTNPVSVHRERIDFVFVGGPERGGVRVAETPAIRLFGDDQDEKTRTGLWPSDHAGLFATMVLGTGN
jgi:endonuclease/exonuclease/phosphatase family metal-dependent hydrolase